MAHLAAAAVTASQQAATVLPVTPDPLFWVLVAVVPSPAEQSTSPVPPVLPVHLPVIGASQQTAIVLPVTPDPLFTVFVGSAEQSTSPVLSVLPVHLPVTVGAEVGQVTAESSAKAPELPHVYGVVAAVLPTVAA